MACAVDHSSIIPPIIITFEEDTQKQHRTPVIFSCRCSEGEICVRAGNTDCIMNSDGVGWDSESSESTGCLWEMVKKCSCLNGIVMQSCLSFSLSRSNRTPPLHLTHCRCFPISLVCRCDFPAAILVPTLSSPKPLIFSPCTGLSLCNC